MTDSVLAASSQEINILVVIDTEFVKKYYPNPSQIKEAPTNIIHYGLYLICTGSRGIIAGQGSGSLNFRANPGDMVSFSARGSHDNSDDAVIIYDIQHWKKDNIFNRFAANVVTRRNAVMPNEETQDGMPPVHIKRVFSHCDAKVRNSGTEDLEIKFALYALSDDGQSQDLFGYFSWDPSITIY
ncbi:inclusion body family protein [Paraherbaspirillum soli]|uniref:Inclusion body family protein n=1 Tax=Paraherbaspirillum soli TaxID=631222 RepID=A0ABW0MGQ7_9BURK